MKKFLAFISLFIAFSHALFAQTVCEGKVEVSKIVHNFGDIAEGSGPVECSFTFKNISGAPMAVFAVNTSCGCTIASWSKEPVRPGGTTVIKAKYTNEDGPMNFDKTLTCYVSCLEKPIVLHLRGTVYEKKKTLQERFPVKLCEGVIGVKSLDVTFPNLEQGQSKNSPIYVANLTDKPVLLSYADMHECLRATNTTIPPHQAVEVNLGLNSSETLWGRNHYQLTLVAGGVKATKPITITSWTKPSFSTWSDEKKANAGKPFMDSSSVYAGELKTSDKPREVEFTLANKGRSTLKLYKCDLPEDGSVSFVDVPEEVASGSKVKLKFIFDPSVFSSGEVSSMITLTTSSPIRPLINIYIAAIIK